MQYTSNSTTDIIDLISTVWHRHRSANYDDDETYFDCSIYYVCTTKSTTTGGVRTTARKRRRRSVSQKAVLPEDEE